MTHIRLTSDRSHELLYIAGLPDRAHRSVASYNTITDAWTSEPTMNHDRTSASAIIDPRTGYVYVLIIGRPFDHQMDMNMVIIIYIIAMDTIIKWCITN